MIEANSSRYSSIPSRHSLAHLAAREDMDAEDVEGLALLPPHRASFFMGSTTGSDTDSISTPYDEHGMRGSRDASYNQLNMERAAQTGPLLWDEKNKEDDDYLHNPDMESAGGAPLSKERSPGSSSLGFVPVLSKNRKGGPSSGEKFNPFSIRGIVTTFVLVVLMGGIIGVFAFWPIGVWIQQIRSPYNKLVGWNYGGTKLASCLPSTLASVLTLACCLTVHRDKCPKFRASHRSSTNRRQIRSRAEKATTARIGSSSFRTSSMKMGAASFLAMTRSLRCCRQVAV